MDSLAITHKSDRLLERIITPVIVQQSELACERFDLKQIPLSARVMWDTGSIITCISKRFAELLQLRRIESRQLTSIHGSETSNVYMLDIVLPDYVTIQNILASEIPNSADFDVIIGMNIIGLGNFAISNDKGKTLFSFRLPALNIPIDFSKEEL
jgi:hypothetical protein